MSSCNPTLSKLLFEAGHIEVQCDVSNMKPMEDMCSPEGLHSISILVENSPGVLARVAHVFTRRGFNLESLVLARTEDHTVSRITSVMSGDAAAFTRIGSQLLKLIDVIQVIDQSSHNITQEASL